jgi:extracellular factor (EF) 3-hydroxypalmitic acid methyl ester biosynthesis protein
MQQLARRVEAVGKDPFDEALLDHVYECLRDGRVEEGMNELLPGLQARRLSASDGEWADVVNRCLRHPLRQLLHQDPLTHRAFAKPRGYAGDAPLLDFIYGCEEGWPVPEGTTELGRKIFAYTTRSAACEGVRARRGFIAGLLDRLAEATPRPHVLSVAAGHLREVLLSGAVRRRKLGRYVALDADRASVGEVEQAYAAYGVEAVAASVRHLLTGRVRLGTFDLVYSTGLYDYVPATTGRRLTWALFEMLRPRGRLVLANFLPGIPDLGYMESYMAWNLIYRTRLEMLDLTMDIPQAAIRDVRLFAEENQNILFLEVTKN